MDIAGVEVLTATTLRRLTKIKQTLWLSEDTSMRTSSLPSPRTIPSTSTRERGELISLSTNPHSSTLSLYPRQDLHDIPYASRYDVEVDLPRFQMPSQGCDVKVAYQLLHDELMLGMYCSPKESDESSSIADGNPNMNLAS